LTPIRFFAPCPRGLEAALADELRAIGASILAEPSGGVQFEGDLHTGLAANLHSRIASRILQQVATGPYRSEDDLYRLALDTEWERWHAPTTSLRVDTTASGSPLRNLQFATLRSSDSAPTGASLCSWMRSSARCIWTGQASRSSNGVGGVRVSRRP
jgi:putative N6-adenine-specific DNA methylase